MYSAWSIVPTHKLKNSSLTIQGYSVSAVRTGFYINELKLMLDCGLPHNKIPNFIAITHGHTDHFYEIAHCIQDKYKILCPFEIKDELQKFINQVYLLNGQPNKYHDIIGLQKKENYELNENFGLQIFECFHSIPTIGYGIYQKVKKLKDEFKGLSKKEILQIKKSNIELTYDDKNRLLCYLCDTTIDVLRDPTIFTYSTIMIECTFLGENTLERAKERKHINWLQLEPFVKDYPDIDFILFHWSNMYSTQEIKKYFETYLMKYWNLKIWL